MKENMFQSRQGGFKVKQMAVKWDESGGQIGTFKGEWDSFVYERIDQGNIIK